MDTLARRIADVAGGYAKLSFDPTKPFTPDHALLKKYPGCFKWSENPSFPPKAWNQMAMSWGRSYSSMPLFKDYLQQRLDRKSFIIPRHKSCAYTFSNSATPSNLNKLINNITSKPNNYWVIFDHKEAQTVENAFKNNIFKNWCEQPRIRSRTVIGVVTSPQACGALSPYLIFPYSGRIFFVP